MKNRKPVMYFMTSILLASTVMVGCASNTGKEQATATPSVQETNSEYVDGIYRGFYNDGGIEQISIQFELKEGKFSDITFRGINYKDGNYLADNATAIQKQILAQYNEAIDYLKGKSPANVTDLLDGKATIKDQDAVTGATLRANKLVSAINDGLGRGVYKLTESTKLATITAADGTYRGFYYDGGIEQISVQFIVKDGKYTEVTYRGLNYKDGNYKAEDASAIQKAIKTQYEEAANYLVGKELSAVNDLYKTAGIVNDVDAVTGATLRTSKLISAIHDGYTRGLYKTADTTKFETADTYTNGTYRGFYTDGGVEQVSLQFELQDNKFTNVTFRGLKFKEDNYLAEDANAILKAIRTQYEEAANYLVGKEVSAINDLYVAKNIVKDVDAVTGATLRTNKFISAIQDGLNRGLYKVAK